MAETEFKYDVFISYSHKDEEWVVNSLLPSLEDAGLKVCIDFRDFVPGKPSRANMRDACKGSAYTVLVMTPAWIASEWTAFEALLSFLHDPSGKRQRTVPLMVEKCDIPEDIQIFTYVDFLREDRRDNAWKQLFTALGKPNAKLPGVPRTEQPVVKTPEGWFLAHPYGMPPNFTGRRAERNMLTGWLNSDKDHPLLIIRALGGFGKSALTWHWLTHDVDSRQWQKVVFWSFYEGDASFDHFLIETLKYLGVLNAEQLNQHQQAEVLLSLMRDPGILLVLDGFERVLRAYGSMSAAYQGDELQKDKDDMQDSSRDCIHMLADAFLRSIGAYGGMLRSKVLMTTRLTPRVVEKYGQFLQGVREEILNAMYKDDAVEFFHAQGIRGTHAEIEQACEPYGYHPLSLRILSGWILNNRKSPGDISTSKNLEITKDIIQNKHHILEVGFSSLSPSQKKLLGRIACFRSAMTYDALKTLHEEGKGSATFDESLKALESRGFLHWDRKTNKYDLHPIVRRYAYDRLTAADRTGAHERLMNYFEAVHAPEKVNALEDIASVIELYHHMVRAGKLDEAADLYYDRLQDIVYFQLGAYQTAIELLTSLFPNGEDRVPQLKKESDQAWALNELANAYSLSGQPRRAVPLFETHNTLREKAGDQQNLATGLGNVAGMAQLAIGQLKEADHNLRRRIELSRQIADAHSEAIGHLALAGLLLYLGSWEKAVNEVSQAQELFEASQAKRDWFSKVKIMMSKLALRTQDFRSALSHAEEALNYSIKAANEDGFYMERDFIIDYLMIGKLSLQLNKPGDAEKHLMSALTRCRAVNQVDVEAEILLEVAKLSSTRSDFKDAKEKAEEALTITERSGYVLQGADVNLFLAQYTLEQAKDALESREYAETALKLATCDGPPYYYKVAYEEAKRILEKLK